MTDSHLAYLSLGSNIEPEKNLVRCVQRLQEHGRIERISNAWESESVGATGPNYLNACLAFVTSLDREQLKEELLLPIEIELGRRRSGDRFAPRTIDIDIILFDDQSCGDKYWEQAFVMIPLAEICPTCQNPITHESAAETAARLRRKTWLEARREVLRQFGVNNISA